jgi:hypothetical protein
MSVSVFTVIITGFWLGLNLLLAIALAEVLPADFFKRNYTGATLKPRPAAQLAFLTITGTFLAMFLVWAVTPRVSHYYDYLLAGFLPLLAGWWFFALVIAAILRQISREAAGWRWAVAIGLAVLVNIGFFVPVVQSYSLGLITPPQPFTGTLIAKNTSTSRYGTTYVVAMGETTYKVTRSAYAELAVGEAAELVRTEFENMIFPVDQVKLTWFGAILFTLILLSFSGALVIIGSAFVSGDHGRRT